MLSTDLSNQGVVTSATPATKVLLVGFALPWHMIIENSSGGDITVVRLRFRTHEKGPWSPWEAVSSGLPVAEGDTLSLAETQRLAQAIEVELTAASAGVATMWLVGA